MNNPNLTVISAGSGTAGGVFKAFLLNIGSISAISILEVMVYAVFSALAGIATKVLIDRITERMSVNGDRNGRGARGAGDGGGEARDMQGYGNEFSGNKN
jgi:hypothetical protein